MTGAAIEQVLAWLPEEPEKAAPLATEFQLSVPVEGSALSEADLLLGHYLPRQLPLSDAQRMAARFASAQRLRLTSELVATLEEAGVAVLVLKGAPLAARLYPEPWLRPSSDIDLLVRPVQLGVAQAALEGRGCVVEHGRSADPLDFGHDVALRSREGRLIELHYSVTYHFAEPFDVEALFARSRRVAIAEGSEVSVLGEADELVYLGAHAAAHFFEGTKWLFDLKLAARALTCGWDEVVARAGEHHVSTVLGLALEQAVDRVRAPVPEEVCRRLVHNRWRRRAAWMVQRVPKRMMRTRVYLGDVLLADGVSAVWRRRVTGPILKRLQRLGRHLASREP